MSFHSRIISAGVGLVLAMMVPGMPESLAETYRVYGVRSSDVLFIRAGPSAGSRKTGSIPPYGRGIRKLGPCVGNWCKISYRGMTGWASMRFLVREVPANTPYRVKGIASWDVLYIRARPSVRSRKIGAIPPNGRGIRKLGPCRKNWCKISYRGVTGWVSMMYLVPDTSAAPVAPATDSSLPDSRAPVGMVPGIPPGNMKPGNLVPKSKFRDVPPGDPAPDAGMSDPLLKDLEAPSPDLFEGLEDPQ